MNSAATLCAAVCAVATLALVWAEWRDLRPAVAITKMIAASSFVGIGVASDALSTTPGRILLLGLVCCWIGDALLLSPGRSRTFRAGILAFLTGHLAYAFSFFSRGVSGAGLFVAGLAIAGAAALALAWLRPHLPDDFRIAVGSYLGVISFMVAAAFGAWIAGAPLAVLAGAFGFAVSDLSVARERFVSRSFINVAWGLPLYFGSQCLLASSAGS